MSFSSMHLYFEDVEIGQEWESAGRTVTETDIVNFAGISGDFNPIHIDHEFAKSTPFRRPIAHGLLVFSIASGLTLHSPPMRTMAFMGVRVWTFREPIFIGDTVRMKSKVIEKSLRGRGRRGEVVWQRTIVNQDGRVVQEGVLVTLVEGRGSMKSGMRNGPSIESVESIDTDAPVEQPVPTDVSLNGSHQ